MRKLILDVENTTTKRDDKLHLDPFEEDNSLVMVGYTDTENRYNTVLTFDHAELDNEDTRPAVEQLQHMLDTTELLIMHNAQHDLQWLWATGFKYDGKIYDTMLAEYLLCRGIKRPLSLEACAERYELSFAKQGTLKEYFSKGYSTRDIPHDELSGYLKNDLSLTLALYERLESIYRDKENESLIPVRDITNEVCKSLTRMYMRGVKVDGDALDTVRKEFEREKVEIQDRLQNKVSELMGDTSINLSSPEQVSWVIFSRKVKDKKYWAELFDYVNTQAEFINTVEQNTDILYKTEAYHCKECNGKGYVHKRRKDGSLFKKPNRCKECDTRGYLLRNTKAIAGLKFKPPSKKWVSANGFSTSKQNIEKLEDLAKSKNLTMQQDFLKDLRRLSALDSYLSSFVNGIDVFTKADGLLHVGLTQHVTSTGRFSGRNPNMQNMPRGNTFPVKRVFVSRWEGGHILEADFAQLEFRVAAYLSQDDTAIDEVKTGFDVHSYTAKVISNAGQPTSRQDAKAHTFAPLYGASGYGRSPAEAAYYTHFNEKYKGIARWHKSLAREAMTTNRIVTPSGRQYEFENMERRYNGTVSNYTMIKNYPVQGFATGDIVPIILLEFEKRLDKYLSCVVNTVHDSIVVDVHPDEVEQVIETVGYLNDNLSSIINDYYSIDFNVPLLLEAKIGPNWLETKDV